MSEKYSQKVQTIHPEQFSRTNSGRNLSRMVGAASNTASSIIEYQSFILWTFKLRYILQIFSPPLSIVSCFVFSQNRQSRNRLPSPVHLRRCRRIFAKESGIRFSLFVHRADTDYRNPPQGSNILSRKTNGEDRKKDEDRITWVRYFNLVGKCSIMVAFFIVEE